MRVIPINQIKSTRIPPFKNNKPTEETQKKNLEYIKNWSIKNDLSVEPTEHK